jgi:hypothetical protein
MPDSPDTAERRVHLGSWTFFADISGRVRQTIDNPIVTTAAVAVPVDLVSTLRTRMRRLFPGDKIKWKFGGLPGFERIVDVLVKNDLAVAVYQLHIGDATSWIRYFEQGREFMSKAGDDAAYLQPSMTLRIDYWRERSRNCSVGFCVLDIGRTPHHLQSN